MNIAQQLEQERSVLRWGGIAGVVGSMLFLVVFVIVGVFVGGEPAGLAEWVERFPDIRMARTAENGGYLLVLILWVPHFLALFVALRRTNLAAALFGSGIGVVGLTVLAAGALPHVATVPLADIYFGAEATAADQAALALMWQATWGMIDALLFAGLTIVAIGVGLVGVAMLKSPAFGRAFGWFSIVIGLLGIGAGVVLLIDPDSMIAVVSVLSLIVFHLVVGGKLIGLSTVSSFKRVSPAVVS